MDFAPKCAHCCKPRFALHVSSLSEYKELKRLQKTAQVKNCQSCGWVEPEEDYNRHRQFFSDYLDAACAARPDTKKAPIRTSPYYPG